MEASNPGEVETSSDFLENDFQKSVEPENSLLLNFKDVLQLFEDDAFWDTFGKAIEEKYPGVKESLRDRMKDLENNECEIVIAGETNTGKTTLINSIIGRPIFAEGVLEMTTKFFRVKHSDNFIAKIYRGGSEPTEHSFDSVENLHKMLKSLDKEDRKEKPIYQVDVLLPFPKEQYRNVTIVDTPGIEDTVEFQTMLEEYIPEAVAFVIVIDVSRARGLQKDKALSWLTAMKSTASKMKFFDREDTLIIRNKWDCVNTQKQDELKMKLTDLMIAEWPWVKESHIFDICLRPNSRATYYYWLKEFEDAMNDLIKRKQIQRIQAQGQFLSDVILEASKLLAESLKKEMDHNDATHQTLMENMTKNKKAVKKLQSTEDKIVKGIIENTVINLYEYVNSEEFSRLVLHQEPTLETYFKVQIDGQIIKRMEKAIIMWLNENVPLIVNSEFDIILQDITSYEKMSNLLQSFKVLAERNIVRMSNLQRMGVSWAVFGGNSLFLSLLFGPQAPFLMSPFWAVSALSLGVAAIAIQFNSVEAISRDSFEKRVKSISGEKLHILLHHKLERKLREFHRQIFSDVLATAIQSMSNCVNLMSKNVTKMDTKQNDSKSLLAKIL